MLTSIPCRSFFKNITIYWFSWNGPAPPPKSKFLLLLLKGNYCNEDVCNFYIRVLNFHYIMSPYYKFCNEHTWTYTKGITMVALLRTDYRRRKTSETVQMNGDWWLGPGWYEQQWNRSDSGSISKVQQTEHLMLKGAVWKKERNSEPQCEVWCLSNGTIQLTISTMRVMWEKWMEDGGMMSWIWNILSLTYRLDLLLQYQVGTWTYKLGAQQRGQNWSYIFWSHWYIVGI